VKAAIAFIAAACAILAAMYQISCNQAEIKPETNSPRRSIFAKSDPDDIWAQYARNENHDTFVGGKLGELRLVERVPGEPIFEKQGLQQGGVIYAGGKLFVPDDQGRILCVDALTGERIWQTRKQLPPGRFHVGGRYYKGVLFYGTMPGGLRAIDANSGNLLWESEGAEQMGGVRTIPVIRDGRLYFADTESRFYCTDAETGKTIWTKSLAHSEPCDADPVFALGNVIFATPAGILYSLNAESGSVEWAASFFLSLLATPALAEENLYLTCSDKGLYEVDAEDGRTRLLLSLEGGSTGVPLVHDGKTIIGDERNFLYCVNSKDASVEWKIELPTPPGGLTLGFEDAVVTICSIHEPIDFTLPRARGELEDYVRRKQPFRGISMEQWREATKGPDGEKAGEELVRNPPEVDTRKVVEANGNGYTMLAAKRAEAVVISWDGTILQRIALPTALQSAPVCSKDAIYALDTDGYFQVLKFG
jgi:outer membrane protein assembly factor BamB